MKYLKILGAVFYICLFSVVSVAANTNSTIDTPSKEVSESQIADGVHETYYPSGKLWIKETYVNGKKIGESVMYYENGNIRGKENYVNGKLDGKIVLYYENGAIKKQAFYKNGKFDGDIIEYNEQGEIIKSN